MSKGCAAGAAFVFSSVGSVTISARFQLLATLVFAFCTMELLRAQEWEAGRFRTNNFWNISLSLDGQRAHDPAELRWFGNDPYSPATGRGEVSYLTFLNFYTDSASALRNPHRSLILGGGANLGSSPPVLPGVPNPTLFRNFVPRQTRPADVTRVAVDFAVIDSLPSSVSWPANWPDRDTFAFELKDGAEGTSLAKFSFRPEALVQNGTTNRVLGFYWTRDGQDQMPGASGLTAHWVVGYHALYRLEVLLSGSRMDVLLSSLDRAGPAGQVLSTTKFVDQGLLSGTNAAENFRTLGLVWELSNTNSPPVPGYNYLAVQDVSVTSGVNTWLMRGRLPLSTPLTGDHNSDGRTLLEEYALGADSPGGTVPGPVAMLTNVHGVPRFVVAAAVRTNDWRLTVSGRMVGKITELAGMGSTLPFEQTDAATGPAPADSVRREFSAPVEGKNSGFFRLLYDLAP